jgi:hypothetical protein
VSEEESGTCGCLQRCDVLALAVDAVVVSLRAALAPPSALDRVHGETVDELPREGVEVGSDCQRARYDENCGPFPTAR